MIDIFSKYAWVFSLKDTKGVTIIDAFQNILNSSERKPNRTFRTLNNRIYKYYQKMCILMN